MKAAPEFKKSPFWDIYNDKVKPGTSPDIKAELEKAYQDYLAEGQRELKEWDEASQAAIDKQKK
jgi:hypothetical protein